MKKILAALLALALLCGSMAAIAEGNDEITVELNLSRAATYAADDLYPAMFRTETEQTETEALPILLLAEKKSLSVQATVKPATVSNRKVTLSVDNEEIVRVRGNTLTGLKAGETVLTAASAQDPSAAVKYLIIVYKPATRVTLTASGKSIPVGGTASLTPAFVPEDATVKQVSWSSSDERIATVDENGTVTGVKRGTAWITATVKDGGKIRGSICMQVVRTAEEITLDKPEVTVDTGRTVTLHATVLPADTNDKNVIWTSSDESIARVSAYGQVTGVAQGNCEIVCTSKTTDEVQAKASVHVQQPVKRITFADVPMIYVNETGKLSWSIEPADATNPEIALSSGNEAILKVSDDGTVTGVSTGSTVVNAVAKDGSNKRSQVKVRIMQHVQSVTMRRNTAYIDVGEGAVTSAVLTPERNINRNMTWESADSAVAAVTAVRGRPEQVRISGIAEGETTVTGTTEDGGLQASIQVKTGDWSHAVKIRDANITGKGSILLRVRNVSEDLYISNIVAYIEAYDKKGEPVAINGKDGSNKVKAVFTKTIAPGETTREASWKIQDYDPEEDFHKLVIRITQYQINGDWVKQLRSYLQPKYTFIKGKKK